MKLETVRSNNRPDGWRPAAAHLPEFYREFYWFRVSSVVSLNTVKELVWTGGVSARLCATVVYRRSGVASRLAVFQEDLLGPRSSTVLGVPRMWKTR